MPITPVISRTLDGWTMADTAQWLAMNVRRLLADRSDLDRTTVAALIGVKPPWMTRITKGTGNPPLDKLERLADTLGVSVAYLLRPPALHTSAHDLTDVKDERVVKNLGKPSRDTKRASDAPSQGDSPDASTRETAPAVVAVAQLARSVISLRNACNAFLVAAQRAGEF